MRATRITRLLALCGDGNASFAPRLVFAARRLSVPVAPLYARRASRTRPDTVKFRMASERGRVRCRLPKCEEEALVFVCRATVEGGGAYIAGESWRAIFERLLFFQLFRRVAPEIITSQSPSRGANTSMCLHRSEHVPPTFFTSSESPSPSTSATSSFRPRPGWSDPFWSDASSDGEDGGRWSEDLDDGGDADSEEKEGGGLSSMASSSTLASSTDSAAAMSTAAAGKGKEKEPSLVTTLGLSLIHI